MSDNTRVLAEIFSRRKSARRSEEERVTSGKLVTGIGLDTGDRIKLIGKPESDFTCYEY